MIDTFAIRSKIVDLALRGKISDQHRNEYVGFEHQSSKKWADVTDDEKYFEIPDNWKYVRVGEVTTINPKNNLDDTMDISFIPMACVKDGFSNSHTSEIKRWGQVKKGFSHFAEGDIGVAKITPCFQNRKSVIFKNLNNGYGAGTTEFIIVRPIESIVCAKFLLLFFQSAFFINKGRESFTGVVGQQRIHKDYLKKSPLPLPPIQEQIRIVDKVSSAFELLDIIDELQYEYLCNMEVLKGKLIDAGIQGKLTKQFSEDGNTENLYEEIRAEKAKLVKECKIKKEKALPKIPEDEIPFDIPSNWKWVRLGEVSWFQGGYAFKSNLYVEDSDNQVIRLGNVKQNALLLEARPVFISDELAKEVEDYRIRENDILITMTGTRRKKDYFYAKCVEQSDLQGKKLYLNQRVGCIRVIDGVYPQFLVIALQNTEIRKIIFERETGAVNQGNLGSEDIKKFVYIPLPPYPEQVRITDKINELIGIMN